MEKAGRRNPKPWDRPRLLPVTLFVNFPSNGGKSFTGYPAAKSGGWRENGKCVQKSAALCVSFPNSGRIPLMKAQVYRGLLLTEYFLTEGIHAPRKHARQDAWYGLTYAQVTQFKEDAESILARVEEGIKSRAEGRKKAKSGALFLGDGGDTSIFSEAETEQLLIFPLLKSLGWENGYAAQKPLGATCRTSCSSPNPAAADGRMSRQNAKPSPCRKTNFGTSPWTPAKAASRRPPPKCSAISQTPRPFPAEKSAGAFFQTGDFGGCIPRTPVPAPRNFWNWTSGKSSTWKTTRSATSGCASSC